MNEEVKEMKKKKIVVSLKKLFKYLLKKELVSLMMKFVSREQRPFKFGNKKSIRIISHFFTIYLGALASYGLTIDDIDAVSFQGTTTTANK